LSGDNILTRTLGTSYKRSVFDDLVSETYRKGFGLRLAPIHYSLFTIDKNSPKQVVVRLYRRSIFDDLIAETYRKGLV
jgi:hypothetical protein